MPAPISRAPDPIPSGRRQQFLWFSGRALLICLPQALVSFVAVRSYAAAGIYPPFAVGTHVALIVALHLLFFGGWGLLSRRLEGANRRWFRTTFAAACLAKGLMLNLVYLASYGSYRLWSAYISWDNLRAIGPHLRGFHLALGPVLFVVLGVAGLVLLGYAVVLGRTARGSLRWLERVYSIPTARLDTAILATLACLVAANFWFRDPLWNQMADRDPILAFWTNRAAADPVLTPEMLADRAAGQSYRVPADFRRRNVFIFTIDCLRADHLAFRGYARDTTPFLTSLQRAGRLQQVDFAISNGNDSPQGIRSILNSRTPYRQNIHNFRLPDLLKRAGYRTHVLGTGDHTTLGNMREHYGPNIDVFRDGLGGDDYTVNDDRTLLESLEDLPPAGAEPAFFYIHLMSVHELGVREEAFQRWLPATIRMDWGVFVTGALDAEAARNTYDNGILQADHILHRIFSALEAKGYMKDYVAVIAGDHGQGLGERGNFGHTRFLFAEDVDIPVLFLESQPADYGPMPFGSQVDIAPTLLDRLGLPVPDRWDGKSLYRSPPPEFAYAAGTRDSGWRALLRRRDGEIYKYMFYGNKLKAFQECLYNNTKDPKEQTNLATDTAHAELLLEFRGLAAKEFNRHVPPLD